MSVPPRRHRLPQRLDWALIPPPLDLSKPIVDDKAALPAIIVTPSSPTGARDFRIAFLAPEPKEETMSERVFSRIQHGAGMNKPIFQFKPRTLFFMFLAIFILFCHFLSHRLWARHVHLRFELDKQGGVATAADGTQAEHAIGWFDMNDYRDARHARDFTVEEKLL